MLLGAVFLLLLLAAGGTLLYMLAQPGGTLKEKARGIVGGETALLDYLGQQIVGIANAQLVPELSFETIRYEPPYTLGLGAVRLTAPDGTDVLDLGEMTVTLGEVPKRGEPIRIEKIAISDGAVNLIRDGSVGGFRGFSPLVEPKPEREQAAQDDPGFSLSNVLVLDRLSIEGIDLVYDAGDGSPPMRLDAISAGMDIAPRSDVGEGWYDLSLRSGRDPGLELDVRGALNINTFELILGSVVAETTLDDRTATTLPQQLASVVSRYQLRGDLRASINGRLPLLDLKGTRLGVQSTLTDGRGVFGEYQIPLESVIVNARFESGVLEVDSIQANALGGTANANGRVALGGEATIGWTLTDMRLRDLLASRSPDEPPTLAGVLASSGRVRFPLSAPASGVSGAGDIDIKHGRLANVPVITDLVEVMEAAGVLRGETYRDTFTSPLTFSPGGVTLDDFRFATPAITARGSGTVGFSGSLDMRINGGPVEAIQDRLGDFGKILGAVTDGLITYRVRGSVSEPDISVQPLGIGG